jgi:hypothetical protein
MAEFIERRFPVFRTGAHTDSTGRVRTWTPADLDHIVAAYDPALHEAPIVIGHPSDNSPAFGWVRGLRHEDGTLITIADLLPEFDDMVRKGLFKKRSISLYPDGSLRHIGFLGAKPPAVKGLPDIRFSEGEALTIEFSSAPWPEGPRADSLESDHTKGGRRMKFMEWIRQLAGKEGITLDDLPHSFGEEDVVRRVEEKVGEERARLEKEFSETRRAKDGELREREEKLRVREAQALKDGIASFCEGLLREGRLTPAMMKAGMGMTSFLESVASVDTAIEFGEGEDKTRQTPLEFMESFLRGLPKTIEFREAATADKDPGAGGDAGKRESLVAGYMEKNPKASYRDAVLSVSRDNPELFQER